LPPDLQMWIRGEQLATEMVQGADYLLAQLDAVEDVDLFHRAIERVERGLEVLARRGEVATLWTLASWLRAKAGSSSSDDPSIPGLCARTLRSLWDVDTLGGVAQHLLEGPTASREAAKNVLVAGAAAGAEALARARR